MEIEEKTKHKYSHLHIVHRFCLMLFYGSRRREQKHTIQKQKWRRKNHSHTETHINRITVAQRAMRATMGHVFIKQNKEQQQKFEKKK